MRLKNLCLSLVMLVMPTATLAQNSPFEAAVTINGSVVSYYEIEQRALFLKALGTPGDVLKQARNELIDDRLRQQAARAHGVAITPEEIEAGRVEFSTQTNLNVEQLIEALGQEGIAPETLTDFVTVGLQWRQVLQIRFQGKAFVSEAELDAALALGTTAVQDSVLLSELILPFDNGQEANARALAADLSNRLRTYAAFEEAATTFSAAPSRQNGGKLDWVPLASLPPQIATQILALNVGEISRPIDVPNGVVLFQLRGLREARNVTASAVSLDYAQLLIPGGRTAETLAIAAKLKDDIDTCEDLQAYSGDYSEGSYRRDVLPVGKIPRDISKALNVLDNNEVSTELTQGESNPSLVFLMLCGRTGALAEGDREQIRNALYGQRLEAFGNGYLQELKGDAILLTQ